MAAVPSRVRLAASLVLAVLTLAATGAVPGAADDPQRIISLVPATTEMLFVMGAGGRIAGVSNYDQFPPEVLKRVHKDYERFASIVMDHTCSVLTSVSRPCLL